jgi:hypothetical protein
MIQPAQIKARLRLWGPPAGLAIATLAGLLIALTGGEQPWRGLAWCLLSIPLTTGGLAFAIAHLRVATRPPRKMP